MDLCKIELEAMLELFNEMSDDNLHLSREFEDIESMASWYDGRASAYAVAATRVKNAIASLDRFAEVAHD